MITGTFTGWVRNQDGAYANGGRPYTYEVESPNLPTLSRRRRR